MDETKRDRPERAEETGRLAALRALIGAETAREGDHVVEVVAGRLAALPSGKVGRGKIIDCQGFSVIRVPIRCKRTPGSVFPPPVQKYSLNFGMGVFDQVVPPVVSFACPPSPDLLEKIRALLPLDRLEAEVRAAGEAVLADSSAVRDAKVRHRRKLEERRERDRANLVATMASLLSGPGLWNRDGLVSAVNEAFLQSVMNA